MIFIKMQQLCTHPDTHDVIHHLMILCDPIVAIVIGHINKHTNHVLIHHYKKKCHFRSIIDLCVVINDIRLCAYFLSLGCYISNHTIYHVIYHGQLNMLSLFNQYTTIEYNNPLLMTAIDGQHLKMIRHVHRHMKIEINREALQYKVAKTDCVAIFNYFYNKPIQMDIVILVQQHSTNIISHLRSTIGTPYQQWDNLILACANQIHDQYMIAWVNQLH